MTGIRRKLALGLVVVAAVAALAAAGASASSSSTSAAQAGGTYRVGWESSFDFTDAFDPTGEYLGNAWAIYSNLLVRTLVGYNHVAGPAGNKVVPDLAVALPVPTNGGLTYTFKLKKGVKFAPPVNRAITSADIVYAMERLANPKNGGQYAFYYDDTQSGSIKGWHAFATGKAKHISGISAPNPQTVSFTLTKQEGDFLYRMAMPATGPIPVEVGKCFKGADANKYGRNLVASGPYMYAGSESIDASSCKTIKPAGGYDGSTVMTLVRNPNYNAATDTKAARENNPDTFVFTVNSNADDIFNKVKAGDLEDEVSSPSPKVLREYVTNSSLKSLLKINSGDRTWYITMNLTQPPFDDIHVRKAMNSIMDKASLQKAWGGSTAGSIATHIVPDGLLFDKLKGYDPYKTSAAEAASHMKESKYDSNKDGKCDSPKCKGVLMIAGTRGVDTRMVPIIQAAAAKIGISFTVRPVTGAYPVIQTPSKNIPISERPGWGKDYADASTFFNALFTSGAILPSGNTNYSLVGITAAIAAKVKATGSIAGVPSADADIAKCNAALGAARIACWVAVDKKLMEEIVPWVPYLSANNLNIISSKVKTWNYDQFSDQTAYAHVSVK